jgi:hypothetical protein
MGTGSSRRIKETAPRKNENARSWRTRQDPFREVWPTLVLMLTKNQELEAKTLMDWLIEKEPDKYNIGQLRTLQRRVRTWRATSTIEAPGDLPKSVLDLAPGRYSQSKYLTTGDLGIAIAGKAFPHMLFHFVLPYSRWETVSIAFGESFESLTQGFSNAVEELGAVATQHFAHTSKSILSGDPSRKSFSYSWREFLSHYRVVPSTSSPPQKGRQRDPHASFREALEEELAKRKSRNFPTVASYEKFLQEFRLRRNEKKQAAFDHELPCLKPLPALDWQEHCSVWGNITSS